MLDTTLHQRLRNLTTPHLADACLRVGEKVRCAPTGLRPVSAGMRCAGRVQPARHVGSVDVFLEALDAANPGDILVVDNGGRVDEACVGDLVTLEVAGAELGGILIWGLHRDTDELIEIGLPFFSMGTMPTGPQRLDPSSSDALAWARVGALVVTRDDIVVGDCDGALFISESRLAEIVDAAETIRDNELRQAKAMRDGTTFRAQAQFDVYLEKRSKNPAFSFREHLRAIGGSIEE